MCEGTLPPLGSVENMRRLARLYGERELSEGDLGKLISGVALDVEELRVPLPVLSFLGCAENRRRLVGVIGSGNRSFGSHYQRAARELCRLSGRPMVFEFELFGLPEDVVECRRRLVELEGAL